MYSVLPDRRPHCCAASGHGSEPALQCYMGCHRMIVRGSTELLALVLMTALALAPLLFEAAQIGTEVLQPVGAAVFSDLEWPTDFSTQKPGMN